MKNNYSDGNPKNGADNNKKNGSGMKLLKHIPTTHQFCVISLCFLKDKRLVSSSYDYTIIVYNSDTYAPTIYINQSHDDLVMSICGLKDGNLASSSCDKKIKIWKIDADNYTLMHILLEHEKDINKVIELEDGKICSCSNDKTIKIWDSSSNYKCIKTLKGHTDNVTSIVEIDGSIFSSSDDNTIRIWDRNTYQCYTIMTNIRCFNGLSKLKDRLVIGESDKLCFIDIKTFLNKRFENKEFGNNFSFSCLKNGNILVGTYRGVILCLSPSTNEILFREINDDGNCITCLVEKEDKQIFSSSQGSFINVFLYY